MKKNIGFMFTLLALLTAFICQAMVTDAQFQTPSPEAVKLGENLYRIGRVILMKMQSTLKADNKDTILNRITKAGSLRSLGIYAGVIIPVVFLLSILRNPQYHAMTSSFSGKNPAASVESNGNSVHRVQKISRSREDFVYPSEAQKDPFERKIEVANSTDAITSDHADPLPLLKGVIWKSEDPIAILEDESGNTFLMREGWWISSYKVSAISTTNVILEKDKQRCELKLWEAEERQPWYSLNSEE